MILKRTVSDWRFYLFLGLLVAAPLSKYPSIALPLFDFTSFRLGLYQIAALAFVVLCAQPVYHAGIGFFAKSHRIALTALVLFSILAMASIAWSHYPARSALLASSVLLLVTTVLCAWWFAATELTGKRKQIALQASLYASVTFGVVALLQLVIFTTTNQTLGLLCPGCTAEVFGFPRVNGLAAEPQFFANAMLPFVFAALYTVIKAPSKLAWAALVASVGTIGLTFSRGAYAALGLALLVAAIMLYAKKLASLRRIIKSYILIAVTILGSLVLLVLAASVRYNDTPHIAYETIDSIAEHLTAGAVDLPESNQTDSSVATTNQSSSPQQSTDEAFVSPGYIESSGAERVSAAELALHAWRYHPLAVIFGVGVGNLGPFVVANIDANAPENLTVYIYYVLVLAELGLVGLLSLLTIFGSAIKALTNRNSLSAVMAIGLLTAFAVQFLFFGSYINVVYIWLWLGIALGITSIPKTHKTRVNKV